MRAWAALRIPTPTIALPATPGAAWSQRAKAVPVRGQECELAGDRQHRLERRGHAQASVRDDDQEPSGPAPMGGEVDRGDDSGPTRSARCTARPGSGNATRRLRPLGRCLGRAVRRLGCSPSFDGPGHDWSEFARALRLHWWAANVVRFRRASLTAGVHSGAAGAEFRLVNTCAP
jgi:hypothetical protein